MEIREINLEADKTLSDREDELLSLEGLAEFAETYPKGYEDKFELKYYSDFFCCADFRFHVSGADVLARERKEGDALYLACAFGHGVKLLEALGFDAKGIDIVSFYVGECRKRGLDVAVDDALELKFPDESFDVTVSKDFLRYDYISMDKILMCLYEQFRVLRKGGIAVAYSMLHDSPGSNLFTRTDSQKLPVSVIKSLPFRELRRYTIDYEGYVKRFVDVFEK